MNKIFTFTDPRQEKTHKRLLEIGAGPAAFFKDACQILEGDPPLESSSHLVAHCLREIESSIRDVMLPLDYKPTKGSGQNQKDEILTILASYGIDSENQISKLWLRMADKQEEIALHHLAHRNSLDRPRQRGGSFEELWLGMQDLLDVLLNKMEINYVGYISILDTLLAKTTIEEKDLEILKSKIPNSPVTYNHFFGKLDKPTWLTPLKDHGFFDSPPLTLEHPEGGISYPFWSQGEYLKKMAIIPETQQEVLDICLGIESKNVRVKNNLLEIALLLPVDMSVQIVAKVDEIDNFISPENYGKLIAYLSSNGKSGDAITLARKVLAFVPDSRTPPEIEGEIWHYDPVAIIRDYDYEEIIKKSFPELVDTSSIEALKILFDQLESFHSLKYADKKTATEDDYSEIWRPAIEDHPQNHKDGVRDSLITGARDMCERLITNHPEKMSELISELESRDLPIFRRIKLHLLRKFPTGFEKKIVLELLNKREFTNTSFITHEYLLLAQEQASILSLDEQLNLIKIIEKGGEYDKETFEAMCKQRQIEPTEEVARKHKMVWQTCHLLPFKDITPEIKRTYEDLVAIVGEPEHPDFRIWSDGGSSWGYGSSISDDEFKSKKPEEIIELLKNFEPDNGEEHPLNKTREGTSRSLVAQITEDPSKWSATIPSFSKLDPTFNRSVFSAHREALKQNKVFDWKPILDLASKILKIPTEIKDRKPSGLYGDDPDWNWCRHTLVELIDDGMHSSNTIPIGLRKEVWSIIEPLTRDSNPSPDEASKLLENNQDPLNAAINTTRGDAVDAAIQYGIWLKSSLSAEQQNSWTLEKDAPELKSTLEEKLNISKEPFSGIRAIIGQRLGNIAWLDRKGLETTIPALFPDDPEQQTYFNATWESFLSFNPPYDDLLPILTNQYKRAIKEIGQHSDSKHHLENPDEMLAQNLLQFYFRGKIPLDSGLLNDFYNNAPTELKGTIISFVGRNFKNDKITKKIISRVVTLADNRLEKIKKSTKPYEEIQEFEEFSWWVSSECFDTKWALDVLIDALQLGCDLEGDHLVFDRFISVGSTFPLEVITSLDLMVENDKKGWGVPTWGEELRKVIELVLNSGNQNAITKAKEFIQKLVARGHIQYKDLLL